MWIKDEKMVRKSVIFATVCWALALLGFYGIVVTLKEGQFDFLITSFLVLMVLGGIFFTHQAVEHAKGIFVSDLEISLPGLFRRKRLITQEIEKIIVQDSVFFVKGLPIRQHQAFFYSKGKRIAIAVNFSSQEKRKEIIDSIKRFCPQVEVMVAEESLEKKMKKA